MSTSIEDHILLTVRQTAERTQLGINSVYALVNRPRDPLPSIRVGRTIRIPNEALRTWLEKQTRD